MDKLGKVLDRSQNRAEKDIPQRSVQHRDYGAVDGFEKLGVGLEIVTWKERTSSKCYYVAENHYCYYFQVMGRN